MSGARRTARARQESKPKTHAERLWWVEFITQAAEEGHLLFGLQPGGWAYDITDHLGPGAYFIYTLKGRGGSKNPDITPLHGGLGLVFLCVLSRKPGFHRKTGGGAGRGADGGRKVGRRARGGLRWGRIVGLRGWGSDQG